MKRLKKMMALVIAVAMVMAMALPVMAAEGEYEITVENTNNAMSINGKTYYAYKVFDLTLGGATTDGNTTTYDAYAYSIKSSDWAFATLTAGATTDANGVITTTYGIKLTPSAADPTTYTVDGKSMTNANARSLADALQPELPAASAADGTAVGANEKAVISLSKGGWYAVYGVVIPTDPELSPAEDIVAAVGLTTTDKKVTVNPKASVPTIDKKIKKVQEGTTEQANAVLDEKGQAAVAKIGSTVSYEITATTPDLTGYDDYTYIIGDSLTAGLDYDKTSFALTIDGETAAFVTSATAATTDNELVFASGDKSFTLTIPYSVLKAAGAGKNVVLTYSCTVNSSALTTDYENNTADLEYSRNPYDDSTNHTPDKKTYVIDLNIDVDKIGNNTDTKKLAGAEFKLYKTVGTTTYKKVEQADEYDANATYYSDAQGTTPLEFADATAFADAIVAGNVYVAEPGDDSKLYYKWADNKVTWVDTQAAGDTFTTDSAGKLRQQVRGLDKGDYYLEETKAPEGYNLLSAPVKVTISVNETNNTVSYTATTDGVSASVTNGSVDLTTAQQASGKQPVVVAKINNESGTELPSTGGIGTTIFYVVGAILVIGAGVILITRRRMDA